MSNVCPQCGAPIDPSAQECRYCGEKLVFQRQAQQVPPQQVYMQQPQPQPQVIYQQVPQYGINPAWPVKNKLAAALLAIFVGGLGVHKFYLGKIGQGIVYLLFCWTGIPSLIGFIEGIVYLCTSDQDFMYKHQVRLG